MQSPDFRVSISITERRVKIRDQKNQIYSFPGTTTTTQTKEQARSVFHHNWPDQLQDKKNKKIKNELAGGDGAVGTSLVTMKPYSGEALSICCTS